MRGVWQGRHEVDRCTESARDQPPVSWELWLSPEGNMGILKNFSKERGVSKLHFK